MPILALQRRIREVGRIRLGAQSTARSGKRVPKKLDKFRLTSTDRRIIEAVAEVYGGKATPWTNGSEQQYEVYTDTNEIPIVLPPDPGDMGWSQFYESWAKAFCTRRCDGERDTVRDAACDCDPENRTCKITSRLSMFLPEIPGLGVWRLESHGYYAGVELAGAIEIIESLAGVRAMVPARLRMIQREIRRLINGEPETHQFVVPAIDIDVSVAQVQALNAGTAVDLAVAPQRNWKPVPAAPAPKALGIAEQLEGTDEPRPAKKRANAAAPVPSTGRKPRTAAERDAVPDRICGRCGQPLGAAPVKRDTDLGYIHATDCQPTETQPDPEQQPEQQVEGEKEREPEPEPEQEREAEADTPPKKAARTMKPPTAKMHGKLFATLAEVLPIPTGTPSADEIRRQHEIDLADALGHPDITSHKDIDYDLAHLMIDTLTAVIDGKVTIERDADGGMVLVATDSGEVLAFPEADS